MPSRIIREGWLESESVDRLSPQAERFFLRLCLRADDFGRYHANPQLLKSNLFPLKDDARSADMTRCLDEIEAAGLIRCYEVASKRYVEIVRFNQRTRANHSKFPEPPGREQTHDQPVTNPRLTDDGHLPDTRPASAHVFGVGVGVGCVVESPPPKKPKAMRTAHPIPEDWVPNTSHEELASKQSLPLAAAVVFFRDWALAGGKRYVDWDACFRNALKDWLPDKIKVNGRPAGNAARLHPLDAQRRLDALRERARELADNNPKWLPDGSKDHGPHRDNDGNLTTAAATELETIKAEGRAIKQGLMGK